MMNDKDVFNEVLHFMEADYSVCPTALSEAYLELARTIEAMPDSFSKSVALRHLLESRDWAARASYAKAEVK